MVSGFECARTPQFGILGIPYQQCALGGVGPEIKCDRADRASDLLGSDEYPWPVEDRCAGKFKLVANHGVRTSAVALRPTIPNLMTKTIPDHPALGCPRTLASSPMAYAHRRIGYEDALTKHFTVKLLQNWSMSRLASRAEKRGTLPLANHPDRRAAYMAGLRCPAVDRRFELKMACVAGSAGKITQGAATALHRTRQHLADGRVQAI